MRGRFRCARAKANAPRPVEHRRPQDQARNDFRVPCGDDCRQWRRGAPGVDYLVRIRPKGQQPRDQLPLATPGCDMKRIRRGYITENICMASQTSSRTLTGRICFVELFDQL